MSMKNLLVIIAVLFSISATAQIDKVIPAKPNPPKLVNDFTGSFITGPQREALENKLVAYNDSTSTQIVVVIVNSLEGYEANEFGVALGRKWGVGSKDFSNGIVILISTGGGEGQRDAYITTGYGMEGAIPDVTANRIVDNELIPHLKNGNAYAGIDATLNAIFQAAAGEYKATPRKTSGKRPAIGLVMFIIAILILIFGGGQKGGGTYVSRGGFGGWAAGALLGSLMSGGRGDGGGGFGGGGGGGFGGFGGGSFGGGGAGGKW